VYRVLYNTLIDVLIRNNGFNRITGKQLQDLLREYIMLRGGLMLLPNCFTANDINANIDYLL